MNAEQFRDIITGSRRGLSATLYRGIFAALEVPYTAAVSFRNFLYEKGYNKQYRAALPVISVGNLTLGGTGKTPMTAYLAEFLQSRACRPGIISRGYGKISAAPTCSQKEKKIETVNDEFLELSLRLPDVPHLQNPNRLAAAQEFALRKESEAVNVLILDDAFQHRRIKRDIDLVLLDAAEPFGGERLFPRGTLRETLNGLKRADAVLLSRADFISVTEREKIKKRVLDIAPNVVWGEVIHQPECLYGAAQQKNPLSAVQGKRALAFCGIGNPKAFVRTLESFGVSVVKTVPFPDHYRYKDSDMERLAEESKRCSAETVLCTMKDIVKIDRSDLNGIPLQAVSVGIRFLSGETELRRLLEKKLITAQDRGD